MTLPNPIDDLIEQLQIDVQSIRESVPDPDCSLVAGERHAEVLEQCASALSTLQEQKRKLEELLAYIVNCDREAGGFGLTDCIDNAGKHYQSASLAAALTAAEALLSGGGE